MTGNGARAAEDSLPAAIAAIYCDYEINRHARSFVGPFPSTINISYLNKDIERNIMLIEFIGQ